MAADLLGPNEYDTTIDCSGAKQGIYPKAVGTLKNKSQQDTLFHIYVAWTRAGEPVDLGVTYTKTVDSGETCPWETFTTVKDADGCEVVCVDRQHPTDPNRSENCRAYKDRL